MDKSRGIKLNIYAIIMAGGGGTRFWPLSRKEEPKQFLNLSGKELMINETIDRITGVIPKKDIFIVTNHSQMEKMEKATGTRIQKEHILSEPAARNTAACIGYAAIEILKKYGDGIMCIFPSDHFIKDEITFSRTLMSAINVAEKEDKLVTMGITPTFPSTGYGYIRYDKEKRCTEAYKVIEFKEKPDLETAERYVKSGEYAWNSGMFVWRASTILRHFEELLPDIYEKLLIIGDAMNTPDEEKVISQIYPDIRSISIDYGIMEKADDVVVIPAEFGWSDVGSWDNLGVLYEADENGNVIHGHHIGIDTTNSVIYAKNKLVATIDVDNIVVVETDDTVLVCNKDKSQEVRKIVDILQSQGQDKYL